MRLWFVTKVITKQNTSKTVVLKILIDKNPIVPFDAAANEVNKVRMMNVGNQVNLGQELACPLFRFCWEWFHSYLCAISQYSLQDSKTVFNISPDCKRSHHILTLKTTPKPPPPILFVGWKPSVADLNELYEKTLTLSVQISDYSKNREALWEHHQIQLPYSRKWQNRFGQPLSNCIINSSLSITQVKITCNAETELRLDNKTLK